MKQVLLDAAKTSFRYLLTGDESWLFWNTAPRARWLKRGTPRPLFWKQSIGEKKTLFTVFFSGERFWVEKYLPRTVTMTGATFVHSVLEPLRTNLDTSSECCSLAVLLHMDNASSHRCRSTVRYMEQNGFIPVIHPPYSPDLSPADFFLLGDLKRYLRGNSIRTQAALEAAVDEYLKIITRETLQKVFYDWIRRCDEVISTGGEYCRH
jgi:histone-lysine N-methyltransferase SETMAR